MIRLAIRSQLPINFNQIVPGIEVQRDDKVELVIREFCNRVGIKYDPLMYLKTECGELFFPNTSVQQVYK